MSLIAGLAVPRPIGGGLNPCMVGATLAVALAVDRWRSQGLAESLTGSLVVTILYANAQSTLMLSVILSARFH